MRLSADVTQRSWTSYDVGRGDGALPMSPETSRRFARSLQSFKGSSATAATGNEDVGGASISSFVVVVVVVAGLSLDTSTG